MASGVNQPVPSTLTDRPCRHQPTDQNLTTTRPNFRQTLNRHDNRPSLFLFFPPHKKIEVLPHTFYTFGTYGFARYTKANASQTQKSQAHPPPTNRGLKRLFFTKRKKTCTIKKLFLHLQTEIRKQSKGFEMEKDEIIIQSIIDAAKKLMQQYGLSKTTMEDIAKAAGKGKSTLYYYFKSKDEIFDHVINQEMDDFFQTVKTAVSKQVDASEMLKAYIITKIKTLKTKVNLYRFAIETDLHPEAINDLFIKLKNRYDNEEKKLIGSILKSGIDNKLYRSEIQAEIDILSELLVTCVRGVETEIITHNKYKTLTDKADMLVNILTKGIGR